jgi:hypothetical protein
MTTHSQNKNNDFVNNRIDYSQNNFDKYYSFCNDYAIKYREDKLNKYIKIVEEYISNKNILAESLAIKLLTKKEKDKNCFTYYILSEQPEVDGKDILDTILKKTQVSQVPSNDGTSSIVYLRMELGDEYSVYVDVYKIVTIKKYSKYYDVSLIDLLLPIKAKGYFSDNINIANPLLLLISLYQKIYEFSKDQDLKELLEYEKELYNAWKNSDKKGGDDIKVIPTITTKYIRNKLKDYLSRRIIIQNDSSQRIQVFSDNYQSDFEEIKKVFAGQELIIREQNLHLYNDSRILRYTISIKIDDGDTINSKTPILDIFNSLEYELIPYLLVKEKGRIQKYASTWVSLRFNFIDIWIILLLLQMKKINTLYADKQLKMKYKNIISMHDKLQTIKNVNIVFPKTMLGTYKSYSSYLKKSATGKKMDDYFGN